MPANREQIEKLVAAVPNFRDCWEEFLRETEEEEVTPWFLGMGELAHYIVESYGQGFTSEFPNFFTTIETILQKPDLEIVALIGVGLFEDIQSIASHREFGVAPFRRWLGPRSLLVWDAADKFTKQKAEQLAQDKPRWWQFWRRRVFDADQALTQVESPELRKMIEANFRKIR